MVASDWFATTGDTVIVKAGTAHAFWNTGEGRARFLCEIRPALGFERLLETMFALARDGKTNRRGLPHPLRLAAIADHHRDDLRSPSSPSRSSDWRRGSARPPAWALAEFGPTYDGSQPCAGDGGHQTCPDPTHHLPTEDSLMTNQDQRNTTTRRGMLGVATVGLGAAIGGVLATPVAAYLLAPATQEATFHPVSLGPVRSFTSETGFAPTAAPYVDDPAQPLSSGLAYVHYTGGSDRDWLAPHAMFVVFSNRCTHVGCPAQASAIGFACPCHGSQFDQRGARIAGPALRPLDRFQWEIRKDDQLWITQRWSVLLNGDKARYFPVKAPGQPLTGQVPAADALYPAVTYTHGAVPKSK